MSAKEKHRFEEMAEKDKGRYDREMANYDGAGGKGGKRKRQKDPNAPKRALSVLILLIFCLYCFYGCTFCLSNYVLYMGGLVAEWLSCWTPAQKGLGSNCSHDAVR